MIAFRVLFSLCLIASLIDETQPWGWAKKVGKAIKTGVTTAVKKVGAVLTKGCCGIHPSVCKNKNEITTRKNDIARRNSRIKQWWTEIQSNMAWLKEVNANNIETYNHIQRILLKSEIAVKVLDPNIVAKLNEVTATIKNGVMQHNNTVLKYDIKDIEAEMDKKASVIDSNLNDMKTMKDHTELNQVGRDMLKLAESKQIASLLDTSLGHKLSKAYQSSKFLLTKNKNPQLRTIGHILTANALYQRGMFLVQGTMVIVDAFSKFIQSLITCKSDKNKLEAQIKTLREEHEEIKTTYNKMYAQARELEQRRQNLRNNAADIKLLNEIKIIEDIAKHTSSKSTKSRNAVSQIQIYRNTISTTSISSVSHVQKQLNSALNHISYTVECYKRKLATVQTIYRNCKLGLGNFDTLYREAVADFKANAAECTSGSGVLYTTAESVKALIKEKGTNEFFEKNCPLNGVKRSLVCERKYDGFSKEDIIAKYKVEPDIAQNIISSCRAESLSKAAVCELRREKEDVQSIASMYPSVKYSDIALKYNKC